MVNQSTWQEDIWQKTREDIHNIKKDINYDKYVCQGNFVDPYIVSVECTLLKAKGHLWHKSSMITRVVHVQVLT